MEANLMHTQKNMVTPERRVAFYSKEVEPNHKRAPTSMGGNSSPENGALNP
jgi:hypothetical protein